MKIATTKERILQFIDYKQISKQKFFAETGLKRGFLDADKLNTSIPDTFIATIIASYPEINLEWLITGKGNMINEQKLLNVAEKIPLYKKTDLDNIDIGTKVTDIPLYDINAAAGLRLLFESGKQNMIDTIKIPYITKSDGAIFITGDSMYPLMKSGDIAIYKQIHNLDYLHYGDIYIVSYQIDGDEYVVIKYVQKSEKPNHLKLVSYNDHYNPVDIPLSSITAIAIVQANIRYNVM